MSRHVDTRAVERPISLRDGTSDTRSLHPRLGSLLERLELTEAGTPTPGSWIDFVHGVNDCLHEWDGPRHQVLDGIVGWSSFENLFRIAPVPLMEQDYTEVEEWMDDLRRRGVTSIRDHLDDDIEAIKAVVPKVRFVAANPAAVHAVGLPSHEMVGPIDARIVNEGSKEAWLAQFDAVWNRRPVTHSAFKAATADGDVYDAESILSAPLIDGEPDFSRAVFTLIDVTPHKTEERRMLELMEAKSRFLAAVSHEVRTPLTAIVGFAALLDEGLLDDADRELMVSSVLQQAQEVTDLVEDLLVAARMDIGQIQIASVDVDVNAEIAGLLRAGGSFTADVEVVGGAEPLWATADPSRLRQILRNLLTNAERYGGEHVTITVERHPDGVMIEVADDGEGVPVSERERIFEPYHRAHHTPGVTGSLGIGLSISRQLADLMGGRLIYRYEDHRSVFRLTLGPAVDSFAV